MTTTTANPWNDDWMKAQRQYWDAWASLSKLQMKTPAEGGKAEGDLWSRALDNWWTTVASTLPEDHREVFQRCVEQSKTFFRIGQEITAFLTGLPEAAKSGDQWKDLLRGRFEAMKQVFSTTPELDLPGTLRGLMAFCEMPLDTMRRALSGATALPGDFLQNLRSDVWEKLGEQMHERVDKFLSVPGVGYTRESQEQNQALARLLLDYQKAMQEYLSAHGRLSMDTLERLYKKVLAMSETGGAIKSLRELYDLWVDCGEEAYAEFAMSQEYTVVYGQMVNALMALKHHLRTMVDEQLGAFNMPTRREMNTVLKYQQELRRAIRGLEKQLEGGDGGPKRGARPAAEGSAAAASVPQRPTVREKIAAVRARKPAADPEAKVRPIRARAPAKPSVRPATRWDIGDIAGPGPEENSSPEPKRRRGGSTKR